MKSDAIQPRNLNELSELFVQAAEKHRVLEVRGGGTKTEIGQPRDAREFVDMRGFAGIVEYDPGELVMTVNAGTSLAEVQRALEANNQMLAFEPFDHAELLDVASGATIGGIVMANVSGPRRLSAGAARDHVLGFEGVSGQGQVFKAGSRVVKNVTGYDLPRLMTGSWGQLAALTTLSLKVLPRPRAETTLVVEGLSDAAAVALMARALGSSAEVSSAAHVPVSAGNAFSGTALRLEGFAPSVAARLEQLKSLCTQAGAMRVLEHEESATLWRDVRDVKLLSREETLWRVTLPPASGHRVIETLGRGPYRYFYDWAGGLIWISAPREVAVREAAQRAGGQAVLIRASADIRTRLPALHPEAAGVAALRRKLKTAFDPAGILDPFRFTSSTH